MYCINRTLPVKYFKKKTETAQTCTFGFTDYWCKDLGGRFSIHDELLCQKRL